MDARHRVPVVLALALTVILLTGSNYAIPAFSRSTAPPARPAM